MSECTVPVSSQHGVQLALISCVTPEKNLLTATENRNQQEGLLDILHKVIPEET
jgi:hypothetical protein